MNRMAIRRWKHSLLYYGRMTLLWAATFRALTLFVPVKDESLMIPVSAGIVSLGYTAKRMLLLFSYFFLICIHFVFLFLFLFFFFVFLILFFLCVC